METVKQCRQCDPKIDPKPLSEFYEHPAMADGHLNKCKECIKANVQAYARANPEKIRLLSREKMRRPEYRKRNKKWILEHPVERKAIQDRWAAKSKVQRKAHNSISNAVRDGKIKRGTVCQKCGAATNIEAHHPDYSKPLEVEWLCTKCHGETRHKR